MNDKTIEGRRGEEKKEEKDEGWLYLVGSGASVRKSNLLGGHQLASASVQALQTHGRTSEQQRRVEMREY